jgi:hypothetical protein
VVHHYLQVLHLHILQFPYLLHQMTFLSIFYYFSKYQQIYSHRIESNYPDLLLDHLCIVRHSLNHSYECMFQNHWVVYFQSHLPKTYLADCQIIFQTNLYRLAIFHQYDIKHLIVLDIWFSLNEVFGRSKHLLNLKS